MKKLSTDVEIKIANLLHQRNIKQVFESLKIIQGTSRYQMQFTNLDDFIDVDIPVRIPDAFVEKLDLMKLNCKLYKRIFSLLLL